MKRALVLGSSKGIGKAIADTLEENKIEVIRTSTAILDTSNLENVKTFIKNHNETDIIVFNTGGPPSIDFYKITITDWIKYFNQLFLGFVLMLQNIKIKKGGYIFLISSFHIKEPNPKLIFSNSFRIAFWSVLKSLSKEFAGKDISVINIAPGPIKTDRLINLVDDIELFEKTLPMKRAGSPSEIADFISSIIEKKIKYLTGVSINFDGGASNSLL